MIIKVTPELCYNDCEKMEDGTIAVHPKLEEVSRIGPYSLELFKYDFYLRKTIYIRPGERLLIAGKVIGKAKIYIDYPSNTKRIYIDRDFYMTIFDFMKFYQMKNIILFGSKFKLGTLIDSPILENDDYKQEIGFHYFITGSNKEQPIMTKEGLKMMQITTNCRLYLGECKVCTSDGTALCYGDPE